MRTAVLVLVLLARDVTADTDIRFQWTGRAKLHGITTEVNATVLKSGTWLCEFADVVQGKQKLRLQLSGSWSDLENGDIEFVSPYADARMVFRPQPGGRFVQVESNVDVKFAALSYQSGFRAWRLERDTAASVDRAFKDSE